MTFAHRWRRRACGRPQSGGQGLVEIALVIPVFLLLLMGLFDFGRAIYAYNTVSEAARNGARVAITNQTLADICGVAAGRAVALGLPTGCQASTNVDGVVTARKGFAPNSSCTEINCVQTVTVTYTFQAITPIIGSIVGPIPLRSSSEVPVERRCPPLKSGEAFCPLP